MKPVVVNANHLISYIAPSAPATRRPASGGEPTMRAEIGFTPAWYRDRLGIDFGARWHGDVTYRRETVPAMRAELRRRFPGSAVGGIDRPDQPLDLLTGVHGANTMAAIFGMPIVYASNGWPNVRGKHLSQAEMGTLRVPDLDANPFLRDLMKQLDTIARYEGRIEGFINWQGVLNNALRLRGEELFVDLFEAPRACHHLFGTICTAMIEAIKRVYDRQRASGVAYQFATVSNCLVNMVSPDQYGEFFLPCDQRIAAAFETIGIHNCAWNADPYVARYSAIRNMGYIDMGIASDLARARRLFPGVRRALMYTPMDLADKSEAAIRADFERIARDYAPCDIVLADIESNTPDARVRYVMDLCRELSAEASPQAATLREHSKNDVGRPLAGRLFVQ